MSPAAPLAAVNVEAVVILRDGRRGHPGHYLLGLAAHHLGDPVLGRRQADHRAPERPRDRRRLHVGGFVPGDRRPDLLLRVRWVPLLRRIPGRLPHRALPAQRADAECRQVHDRRRPRLPAERAPGPGRRRARHPCRRRLLPDCADGRRRDHHRRPGRDRLQHRRDRDRRLHARLRRLRRDAGDDRGADRQGDPADVGDRRPLLLRADQDRRQPDRHLQRREKPVRRSGGLPRAGPALRQPDRHALASGSAWCWGPRACRTS